MSSYDPVTNQRTNRTWDSNIFRHIPQAQHFIIQQAHLVTHGRDFTYFGDFKSFLRQLADAS